LKYLKPFNDDNICLKIAELGCGNCRDSVFFADKGNYVYAIDLFSSKINQHEWVNLISDDALCVMQNFKLKTLVDLVYMRWFLHAISYKEAEQLFVSSIHNLKQGGLICIEVRSINDEKLKTESVFNNEDGSYELSHKRWLYNKEMLFKLANDNGLEIIEYSQGFFSPISETETPNPLLIRFIVKKKFLPYYELSDNYKLHKSATEIKKARALKSYEEMNFFNKLIEKHKINYVAVAGTLLGLHRHGGVIPWDDDIDLGFIPSEWEKLKTILPEFAKAGLKTVQLNKGRQYHIGLIDCFLLSELRGNYEGIFKTYCDIDEYKSSVKQRFGYTYIYSPISSYRSLLKRFGDDYFSVGDVNDGFHYTNDKIARFNLTVSDRSFVTS
jgi:hypothetical protein